FQRELMKTDTVPGTLDEMVRRMERFRMVEDFRAAKDEQGRKEAYYQLKAYDAQNSLPPTKVPDIREWKTNYNRSYRNSYPIPSPAETSLSTSAKTRFTTVTSNQRSLPCENTDLNERQHQELCQPQFFGGNWFNGYRAQRNPVPKRVSKEYCKGYPIEQAEKAFEVFTDKAVALREVSTLKQGALSVVEYGRLLKRIGDFAYQGKPLAVRERILISHFIRGVSEKCREEILKLAPFPKTFEDLVWKTGRCEKSEKDQRAETRSKSLAAVNELRDYVRYHRWRNDRSKIMNHSNFHHRYPANDRQHRNCTATRATYNQLPRDRVPPPLHNTYWYRNRSVQDRPPNHFGNSHRNRNSHPNRRQQYTNSAFYQQRNR
ncbi:hypothetical protein PAEPH01_2696, partial [Pancytospora epiphaga]